MSRAQHHTNPWGVLGILLFLLMIIHILHGYISSLELPKIYIMFAHMIQTQFSKPIKILRADNAMEYKESSLLSFLQSQGTISQYSCPGMSPQNGHAERKHWHILDTVRTLLISAKCPEPF